MTGISMPEPEHDPRTRTGIRRIVNAFFYSMAGLRACFKTEGAFRQEIYLGAVMIVAAFFVPVGLAEQILLIFVVVNIWAVELLNTAIERVVDRISFDRHDLSKEAKDIGSAAVFIALIFAGVIWALILAKAFLL